MYHCDWCGCSSEQCECDDRHMAGLSEDERGFRVIVDALELREEFGITAQPVSRIRAL